MHYSRGQISAVCAQLVAVGFPLPPSLAAVDRSDLHAMALNSPFPAVSRAVWSSARAAFSAFSSAGEYLDPAHALLAKGDLVLAPRRHSAQYASSGPIAVRTKKKMRAPRPSSKLGPAKRIRLLKSPAVTPRALCLFVKDATQANLLKQVYGSLPGMASAFRFYDAFFFGLRKVFHSRCAKRWRFVGVAFSTTLILSEITFLCRKSEASFSTSPPPGRPPSAKHAAQGLEKRQSKSFRFPNLTRPSPPTHHHA